MSSEITIELIKLIPSLLTLLIVIILVALFYKPIRRDLLPRISGFKALGIELTFAREQLDKAIEKQAVAVSENDRSQALRRAQRVAPILQGAQLLWVDDHPENNISERKVLRSLGIFVDIAHNTDEAISLLRQTKYDAVISDMERNGNKEEGLNFLSRMIELKLYRWTIFYVGEFDESRGVPPYAFGITSRPDHLLHYILDVLERERS